jgi:hypothetical protein
MVIKSTSYDQSVIIKDILKLHVPQGFIDCDPTYSKGNFYKNIQKPFHKFDLYPQTTDTIKSCATDLPLYDNSVNCIMFDPPFLATSGPSMKKNTENRNIIIERFGVFKNETLLHEFYNKSLKEFYRILNKNGVLIFKCQDKVSGGKNYMTHNIIMMQAYNIGFYPKDLFILNAKNRIISGKHKNQLHCRKFHSYFWVFEKRKSKVNYRELINE